MQVLSSKARIGFVQSLLGISTGWSGGTHLVRLLGPKQALSLLASGRVLRAGEALQLGLADAILEHEDPDTLLLGCEQWLRENYLKGYTCSIRAAKRIAYTVYDCHYAEALDRERAIFAELWGAKDHLEALAKVLKK